MTPGHVCCTEVILRINTRIMFYKDICVLKTRKPQVFLTIFRLTHKQLLLQLSHQIFEIGVLERML